MTTKIICWPSVQLLFDEPGFHENAALCSSPDLYETYGDSAYAVCEDWLNGRDPELINRVFSEQETFDGPDVDFDDMPDDEYHVV